VAQDFGFVKEKPLSEKASHKDDDIHFINPLGEKVHEKVEDRDFTREKSFPGKMLDKAKNLGNTIYETILGKDSTLETHEARDIGHERSLSDKVKDKTEEVRDRQQSNPKIDFYNKNPTNYELPESSFLKEKPVSESGDFTVEKSMSDRAREIVELGFDDVPGSLTMMDRDFTKEKPLFDVFENRDLVDRDSVDQDLVAEKSMSDRAREIVELGFDDVPGSLTSKDW